MQTFRAFAAVLLVALGCQRCYAEVKPDQSPARKLLQTCSTSQWGQCGGISCPQGGCSDAAWTCCPTGFGCSRSSAYYWQCLPNAPTVPVTTTSSPTATPSPTPSPTPATTAAKASPPPPPPSPTPSPTPTPTPATTAAKASPPPPPPPSPTTTTATIPSTCSVTIGAWQQCGGTSNCASGVSCTDAQWAGGCCANGYTCSRGSQYYWQCIQGTASPSPPPPPVATTAPSPPPPPVATTAPVSTPTPTPTSTPTTTSSSSFTKPYSYLPDGNYLTTVNDQLIDQNGNEVILHGIAWYGFGDPATGMVEGLRQGSDSQTLDFATVVLRMKALGFNTIKLPFCFNTLLASSVPSYTQSCTVASTATLMANLEESSKGVANGAVFPTLPNPVSSGGTCNDYLPSAPMDRFLWVINFFATNGFYVVPDWHPGVPASNQEIFSQDSWQVNMGSFFSKLVTTYPGVVGKLILDLVNEPDTYNMKWEQTSVPGLQSVYLNLLPVLFKINQGVPFMVQGTGQAALVNWGDGFITDEATIQSYSGMSDANGFFQGIMTSPYLRQVVLGPHVYGPSVTQTTANIQGTGLWNRLTVSFGGKSLGGYCYQGVCNRFTVVLGEYGSTFTQQLDVALHIDLVAYMQNQGSAAGGHTNMPSWIFWAWNPSSSDTGGVVGTDWLTIQWLKIDKLTGSSPSGVDGLNLKPWYYGP